MTHLLDTSALLAHYLAEPGAERVQQLFEDTAVQVATSVLSLYELELRLHQLGVDPATRAVELDRYRALLDEVLDVTESVRGEAIRLRTSSTANVAAMDVLIAATASMGKRYVGSPGSPFRGHPKQLAQTGSPARQVNCVATKAVMAVLMGSKAGMRMPGNGQAPRR
jgi:predicted nucleic acid-binding protein